jgi:hypothetical protein
MFLSELAPIFQKFTQHPASFMGGFVSGVLRLNLADDPVKSWLNKHSSSTGFTTYNSDTNNGKASGPQSISID